MTTILLAVWVVALGACLGSFLNVVIYRLPRRISLSWPGSHCPACKRPIRWYDNLPVAGWLKLGGRCRDCGAAISARYPVVEALVAALALALAIGDVFWVAQSLPAGMRDPLLWARFTLHLTLMCMLVAAGFIVHDRERPPLRLFVPALLAGLFFPAIWDNVRTFGPVWMESAETSFESVVIDDAHGLLAGALAVLLAWPALGLPRGRMPDKIVDIVAIVTVGVCLGWDAVCVITAVDMILIALWACRWRTNHLPAVNTIAALAVATAAWLPGKLWIAGDFPDLPGLKFLASVIVPGVCIAVTSVVARLLARDESSLKSKAKAE